MNQINKLNTATNTHTSNHQKNALSRSLLAVSLLSLTTLISTSSLVHADTTVSSSTSANASITVAPTIRVTLTGGDLVIDNLIPGSSSDSNIITAAVTTNAAYGYNLLATTGTSATNTNLTHSSNSSFYFTSLSSNKATLNDFSDNTWGYSYSKDNGTTWISGSDGATMSGYNGLPKDNDDNGATGITLISTDTYSATNAIQFKIGAKASTAQASGTYNGVVNFYAVTNPGPKTIANATTMQEVEVCSADVPEEVVYTVKDSRDNQDYKVAKLKDGKCWMVENLNLAGGTALSADDTNVTSTYISSFSTSNNLTKSGDTIILPDSATKNSSNNNLTDSTQFSQYDYSYIFNSGNKENCGARNQDTPCYSYYSWDVATLGSGRSISTENTDAEQSICPKGWKLPTSRGSSATNWQTTSDFYQLAHQYGLDSTTYDYENDDGFYTQAGPGTTPNFLLAGNYYYGGSFYDGGRYGYYWSSTSRSDTGDALKLYFYSSHIESAYDGSRYAGYSVRCLLK